MLKGEFLNVYNYILFKGTRYTRYRSIRTKFLSINYGLVHPIILIT